ncbi:MAG: hypothetical protein HYX42_13295 [Polaromonas sp.]|uniref:hypothetical protein n=1 Tax=Polaromonas sp. TaxID=1869339 RepID=UPI0025EF966E|nr:hypothetical protein [Polaromonas sp.]MBI2727213.1 hypothetical protein [Polaromonas sp.]
MHYNPHVFEFDQVAISTSQELPPKTIERLVALSPHSELIQILRSPSNTTFDRAYPYQLIFSRPSKKFLRALPIELGTIAARVSSVELAMDIAADDASEAIVLVRHFWPSTVFKGKSAGTAVQHAERHAATYLNAPNKEFNVCTYADKTGKLSSKLASQPISHFELRLQGTRPLSDAGILSVGDLLHFNHQRYWANVVRFFQPPTTKNQLGRALGSEKVSETALVKRANRLLSQIATVKLNGNISLHQMVRLHNLDFGALEEVTLDVWLLAAKRGEFTIPVWAR